MHGTYIEIGQLRTNLDNFDYNYGHESNNSNGNNFIAQVAQVIKVVIQTYLCVFTCNLESGKLQRGLFSFSDGFSLFCFQENVLEEKSENKLAQKRFQVQNETTTSTKLHV